MPSLWCGCPWLDGVSGQADRYIIGVFNGLALAGIYAALYGLASRPFLMLATSVELAIRQVYYAKVSTGDKAGERRLLGLWLVAVSTGALLLLLAFAWMHRDIATWLLAAEYRRYSTLMIWIAAGYGLSACIQVVERVCYAHHDTRGVLLSEAAGGAMSFIVGVPMIIAYGIRGAAWAVPIYFSLQLVLATWLAQRALKRGSD